MILRHWKGEREKEKKRWRYIEIYLCNNSRGKEGESELEQQAEPWIGWGIITSSLFLLRPLITARGKRIENKKGEIESDIVLYRPLFPRLLLLLRPPSSPFGFFRSFPRFIFPPLFFFSSFLFYARFRSRLAGLEISWALRRDGCWMKVGGSKKFLLEERLCRW